MFYTAYRWLQDKSIFPVEGSLLDQSFSFISACDYMGTYLTKHMERKKKNSERFKNLSKQNRRR